jgi:DNA-binding NtrC family response regulator
VTATPPLSRLLHDFPGLGKSLPGALRSARSTAPILIVGEPGTGRSTLARAFHQESPRSAGPLIEIDPGAFPSALLEAELFGYRPGAFTGAERAGAGRVELAEGGSLVLDHVEELPLAAHPKLLRLIAEKRFAPLGGPELRADVRFLAVAADDLELRVERGAFRSDLFFRLAVLTFRLPPLRQRREDLPAILDALLADLGERFGRPAALTSEAREWMLAHPWPGNLRQVRNVLERSLVLTEPGRPLAPSAPQGTAGERPLTLAELERRHILAVLAFTRGRQTAAAKILGISRKALWEKRKRYGIP